MQTQEAESEEAPQSEQERFEAFYKGYEKRKYEWFDQLAEERDRLARRPSKQASDH